MPKPPTTEDTPLSSKQQVFVSWYAAGMSGREAARRAGCKESSAARYASDTLKLPNVQKALREAREELRERTQYTAKEAMAELDRTLELAIESKQMTAAARVVELKLRLHGLLIDRQEVLTGNIDVAAAMRQAGARLEGRSARAMAQINRTVGESPAPALEHDNGKSDDANDLAAHVAAGFEAVRADPADASDTSGSGVGEVIDAEPTDAGPAGGIFD